MNAEKISLGELNILAARALEFLKPVLDFKRGLELAVVDEEKLAAVTTELGQALEEGRSRVDKELGELDTILRNRKEEVDREVGQYTETKKGELIDLQNATARLSDQLNDLTKGVGTTRIWAEQETRKLNAGVATLKEELVELEIKRDIVKTEIDELLSKWKK